MLEKLKDQSQRAATSSQEVQQALQVRKAFCHLFDFEQNYYITCSTKYLFTLLNKVAIVNTKYVLNHLVNQSLKRVNVYLPNFLWRLIFNIKRDFTFKINVKVCLVILGSLVRKHIHECGL